MSIQGVAEDDQLLDARVVDHRRARRVRLVRLSRLATVRGTCANQSVVAADCVAESVALSLKAGITRRLVEAKALSPNRPH